MKKIEFFRGKYAFFSNFWPAPVEYDGQEYPTVEHAYQAAKLCSPKYRLRVLMCKTPGEAKHLARSLPMRSGWNRFKVGIMEGLVRKKFMCDVKSRN